MRGKCHKSVTAPVLYNKQPPCTDRRFSHTFQYQLEMSDQFTFDEEHFIVDLVFYNRLLRCFVLFDLKIGELKHQDIGQMQMYVHYYDRKVKLPE